jgi:hypothetical protein
LQGVWKQVSIFDWFCMAANTSIINSMHYWLMHTTCCWLHCALMQLSVIFDTIVATIKWLSLDKALSCSQWK